MTEAEKWIAVAVKSEQAYSLPVPLLRVEELLDRASQTGKQRIRGLFHGGFPDISNVEGILKDFQSLFVGRPPFRPTIKQIVVKAKDGPKKSEILQLSYEDFIIPWSAIDVSAQSSKGIRNDFDLVIHAIAAALGDTKEPPAPLKSLEEADLSPDESLARSSDFAKEVSEKDLELEPQLSRSS